MPYDADVYKEWSNKPEVRERLRKYQQKYRLEHREYFREKENERRAKGREIIKKAKSVPCADCNQEYPYYVMDFDHRDPAEKLDWVPRFQGSRKRLLAEIAKCDIVCSNCHRERSFGNGNA